MRFDMAKYCESHLILKFFQRYHFLFGLKRTIFQSDNLVVIGNDYKIYLSLFSLIFTLIVWYNSFTNNKTTKVKILQGVSVQVMNFLNFYLVIEILAIILFQSIFIDPKITRKMYKLLFIIENFLEPNKKYYLVKPKTNIVAYYNIYLFSHLNLFMLFLYNFFDRSINLYFIT